MDGRLLRFDLLLGIDVTLCGWSAKQTIPLSVLARNQTKGLDSRSPTRLEVGGREVQEKPEGELAQRGSREREQKGPVESAVQCWTVSRRRQ